MEAIERAAEALGSQTALADLLKVSKGAVSQWKEPGRRVPAEYCPVIERATRDAGRPVLCEELRPDVDWAYLRLQAGQWDGVERRHNDSLPPASEACVSHTGEEASRE